MNKIDVAIRKLGIFWLTLLFIVVTSLIVYFDVATGPLISFALIYILDIYFAVIYLGKPYSYVIAFITSLGRTYGTFKGYPTDTSIYVPIWQFLTNLSVHALFCYLITYQYESKRNLRE